MAILTETDSRPGLIGYEETNKPLYSDIETETTKKILREYEQKKQETILDLTLNQIIDNTVTMVGDFTKDYMLKIHEVNLEEKMDDHLRMQRGVLKIHFVMGHTNYQEWEWGQ